MSVLCNFFPLMSEHLFDISYLCRHLNAFVLLQKKIRRVKPSSHYLGVCPDGYNPGVVLLTLRCVPLSHGSAQNPGVRGYSMASHGCTSALLHETPWPKRMFSVSPSWIQPMPIYYGLKVEKRIIPVSFGDAPDLPGISRHWIAPV